MKRKSINILLIILCFNSSLFSQIKKYVTPNPFLKSQLIEFKYQNFSFKKKWDEFKNNLSELNDDDEILINAKITPSPRNRTFLFTSNTPFLNIKFDKVFLIMEGFGEWSNLTRLKFIKQFKSPEESDTYFRNFKNKYILEPKGKDSIYSCDYKNSNNYTSIYLDDDKFVIEINDFIKNYLNSIVSQYDYDNSTESFKEIDNDNTFKSIKFGTSQKEVKKIVNFVKTESTTPYSLVTDEQKYAIWKGIYFDNLTQFYFSKEKYFSGISLCYPYKNREEFDSFILKIRKILGDIHLKTNKDEFEIWHGKNISIILSLKYNPDDVKYKWIYLYINSKHIKTEYEKDF